MSSSEFYTEQLLDRALDEGTAQDNWMSVVYEHEPLAYIRLDEDDITVLRDEPGVETYHDFLVKLDSNRDDITQKLRSLDSYGIVDHTFEVNPSALRQFAGDDFERHIDKEVMNRFDEQDRENTAEDIGDESDMLFEGMDPIVRSVVSGRIEEFKESMNRKPVMQNSLVVYEESLGQLYTTIREIQKEYE